MSRHGSDGGPAPGPGVLRPAPTHRGWVPQSPSRDSGLRRRDAEVSVLRVTAVTTGLVWALQMVFSRHGSHILAGGWSQFRDNPLDAVVWIILLCCALIQFPVCLSPCAALYRAAMATAGLSYVAVLGTDVYMRRVLDSSPLAESYIGDSAGLPAIMLAAAFAPPYGILLALVLLVLSAPLNNDAATVTTQVLSAGHAVAVVLPFLLAFAYARSAARRVDRELAGMNQMTETVIRNRVLCETEARFLAHVHDTVLTLLRAVAGGQRPAVAATVLHHLRPGEIPSEVVRFTAGDLVHSIIRSIGATAPDTVIEPSGHLPPTKIIPGAAVAALCDALQEACRNSVRHAPDAHRRCRFRVRLTGDGKLSCEISFSDDGKGFDPDTVPADRAGVRKAIIGRVTTTPGCRAHVESAPGEGTVVTVGWSGDGSSGEPDVGTADLPGFPPLMTFAGLSVTFSHYFAAFVVVEFLGLSLVGDPPVFGPAWWIAAGALVAAMFGVVHGEGEQLGRGATGVVAVASVLMVAAGTAIGEPTGGTWPQGWWMYALQVSLPLLAMRRRPGIAIGTAAVCFAVAVTVASRGYDLQGIELRVLHFIPSIVAGGLLPLLLRRATAGLPYVVRRSSHRIIDRARNRTMSRYLEENCTWIGEQVQHVLDPELPEDERVRGAGLLELRLRDSIRSPLLDVPVLTEAVWKARLRGVRVSLLDERSGSGELLARAGRRDAEDEREGVDTVCTEAVGIVAALSGGSVTVRLLPVGREHVATVLAEDRGGVRCTWFDADGTSTTRRVG